MNKLYMGLDIGSVTTKGVIIDKYNNIIASSYLYTEGNPIKATKEVVGNLKKEIEMDKYKIVSIGTTGSARKLIGTMLGTSIIRNEVMAQAIGTIRLYPEVKTIFEIGGEDCKIILVNDGVVVDYAINTLCTSLTGSFLSSLSRRLDVSIGDVSKMAFMSLGNVDMSARCMVEALNDLIHKVQEGYKKEDVLNGACRAVARNYINNVTKRKRIVSPIVFNGGVSKNEMVIAELEKILNERIIVNKNSHLMGAIGVAIMARESGIEKEYDLNIENDRIETEVVSCRECANNCQMVAVYRNLELIDCWGNRCDRGKVVKNTKKEVI